MGASCGTVRVKPSSTMEVSTEEVHARDRLINLPGRRNPKPDGTVLFEATTSEDLKAGISILPPETDSTDSNAGNGNSTVVFLMLQLAKSLHTQLDIKLD